MCEPGTLLDRSPRTRAADFVRIAIVDPHDLVVAGLAHLIGAPGGGRFRIVDGHRHDRPDVVLYGVAPDDRESIHDPDLHALLRNTSAVVIATYWDESSSALEAALACGAHGALSKKLTSEELLEGIEEIIEGRGPEAVPPPDGYCHPEIARAGLSRRELDVLGLVAIGLTNQEIADRLYLSINSVKTYVRGGYRKIGAVRRTQAVIWIERHGLTPSGPADAADLVAR